MTEYEKINKEIEELEPIIKKRMDEFDTAWFGKAGESKKGSFLDWEAERELVGGEELKRLTYLYKKRRQIMPYILEDMPDYGKVYSLQDFIDNVKDGGFIDYDGYGYYVKYDMKSNIMIIPSDVTDGFVRDDFDSVIWFNR